MTTSIAYRNVDFRLMDKFLIGFYPKAYWSIVREQQRWAEYVVMVSM